MTKLPIAHLQRRAFLLAAVMLLGTGILVSLAGIWPLASAIKEGASQSLTHIHGLEALGLAQYQKSLGEVAHQVSSRSALRQALADFQRGTRTLSQLRDFSAPRLQDALGSTPGIVALVRFTKDGELVASLGASLPEITQAFPKGHTWKTEQDIWIGPPMVEQGQSYILVGSPIFDSTNSLLGHDLLVFSANPIAQTLHQHAGKGVAMEEYIAIPASDGKLSWFGVLGARIVPLKAAPIETLSTAAFPSSPVSIAEKTFVAGPIPGSTWHLVISAENKDLYGGLYRSLLAVGVTMAGLLAAGLLGLVMVLRPLHGLLLVKTQDLEAQVASLRGLGEQLEQERARLAASNQELEQFAYAASHDLQQPLRAIASFLELLRRRYRDKLDDEAQEFIAFAVDGATRMRRMITDLLEYSRVGRIEQAMRPLSLNDAVQAACDNLALRLGESKAEIAVDPLPVVMAEVSQMTRVFQNLIDNALKYAMPGRSPIIKITAQQDGTHWIIAVADNGIGIDPSAHKNAFRLFQRLHAQNSTEGTGMGLAMCAKIIAHHQGRIWLESTPDVGSTFFFTLPCKGLEDGAATLKP